MTDAPERIMLQRTCGGGWSNFTTDYGTEYVRADLYEDLRARLATAEKRAWDEGRKAAKDAIDDCWITPDDDRGEGRWEGVQASFEAVSSLPNPHDMESSDD